MNQENTALSIKKTSSQIIDNVYNHLDYDQGRKEKLQKIYKEQITQQIENREKFGKSMSGGMMSTSILKVGSIKGK